MLMVIKIPGFTLTKRVKPQMLLVSGTQIQGGLPQLWRGGGNLKTFQGLSTMFSRRIPVMCYHIRDCLGESLVFCKLLYTVQYQILTAIFTWY